jgi:solute carrier family 25 (mitochondrial carnitine/acylcarnitine transporter), member 20/29
MDEAISGGVGGVCGVLFGHPLDTVKARLQTAVVSGLPPAGAAGGGRWALWRGVTGPLLTASSQNALCFHSYSAALGAFREDGGAEPRPPPSLLRVYVCGCLPGLATTTLVVPVDLLKLQQQVSVGAAPSTLSLAASIVRREGPLGLYRGTRVTLLRDVPSSGVYFAAYELLNAELPRRTGCSDTAATFVAGGAAGVLSWLSIYPLDVVKSRLQAQPGRYSGLLDCLKRSVAEEGLGVLSRGLTACLLRAFVVNAAIFSGVEASRTLLSGRAI